MTMPSPAPTLTPTPTQSAAPASSNQQEIEAFGGLGPVLVFTFVLWVAIMIAVGVTV